MTEKHTAADLRALASITTSRRIAGALEAGAAAMEQIQGYDRATDQKEPGT
jgi:hypothetical protein